MPPKAKYSRELIIETAYEMTRENGIDSVVAREVGKRLGTTVTPIFSCFENMDELRMEVIKRAKKSYDDYLKGCLDYYPAFKEMGLRWVQYSIDEPNLYRLLFFSGDQNEAAPCSIESEYLEIYDLILPVIKGEFNLSDEEAGDLLRQMIIYSNGIAAYCVNGNGHFTKEEIADSLSEACLGLVFLMKVRTGEVDIELATKMANSTDIIPRKE